MDAVMIDAYDRGDIASMHAACLQQQDKSKMLAAWNYCLFVKSRYPRHGISTMECAESWIRQGYGEFAHFRSIELECLSFTAPPDMASAYMAQAESASWVAVSSMLRHPDPDPCVETIILLQLTKLLALQGRRRHAMLLLTAHLRRLEKTRQASPEAVCTARVRLEQTRDRSYHPLTTCDDERLWVRRAQLTHGDVLRRQRAFAAAMAGHTTHEMKVRLAADVIDALVTCNRLDEAIFFFKSVERQRVMVPITASFGCAAVVYMTRSRFLAAMPCNALKMDAIRAGVPWKAIHAWRRAMRTAPSESRCADIPRLLLALVAKGQTSMILNVTRTLCGMEWAFILFSLALDMADEGLAVLDALSRCAGSTSTLASLRDVAASMIDVAAVSVALECTLLSAETPVAEIEASVVLMCRGATLSTPTVTQRVLQRLLQILCDVHLAVGDTTVNDVVALLKRVPWHQENATVVVATLRRLLASMIGAGLDDRAKEPLTTIELLLSRCLDGPTGQEATVLLVNTYYALKKYRMCLSKDMRSRLRVLRPSEQVVVLVNMAKSFVGVNKRSKGWIAAGLAWRLASTHDDMDYTWSAIQSTLGKIPGDICLALYTGLLEMAAYTEVTQLLETMSASERVLVTPTDNLQAFRKAWEARTTMPMHRVIMLAVAKNTPLTEEDGAIVSAPCPAFFDVFLRYWIRRLPANNVTKALAEMLETRRALSATDLEKLEIRRRVK
jgi:hypothetical protein